MDWKKAHIPQGCRLFKAHSFTYMSKGATFQIEVDEHIDGGFTGHAEHSTDKNLVIDSTNGTSLSGCIEALVAKIEKRL